MGAPSYPNYHGRQLLRELKRLRELAGMTQEEAGAKLHVTLQKLSRIENGQLPGYHELCAMLTVYGVPKSQQEPFVRQWELARQRGWWRDYGMKDSSYVCMEHEASSVVEFQLGLLPALLQTEHYASRTFPPEDVAIRLKRQERLTAANPLRLHTLVHEPVLRQGVDAEQLSLLVDRAMLPNVTLQVVPQSAGLHPGLAGSMILLAFDDPQESDIVFTETPIGIQHSQDEEKIAAVRALLDQLKRLALSQDDSLELLMRR